ncbi:MAG: DUF2188 domain-containing protein [Treponema sp.]|jgi:hypothetical protein|nr:DUF2188 domain-containing protein [Treponema sp.]
MTITNKLNLPAGLVKAVSTERHNAAMCLSATTLLQGVKQIILTDRYWEQLEDDAADRIWAIWGSAVHSLLENEGEHDFTEQEMSYKVGDITVTGRIDNFNMKSNIISDYKTASVNKIRFNDFSEWYTQGMIYAWLLSKNKFPVNKCRFIALLKDHSKTDAMRDHRYPQNPVYVYEFPVTAGNLFKTGNFIRSKVSEYQKYFLMADDEIPPCSPNERWERPSKYAVMKEGRKNAVKLFDDKKSAEERTAELGKGHFIEQRSGGSVKCQNYCLCCNFCNYYVKMLRGKTISNRLRHEDKT